MPFIIPSKYLLAIYLQLLFGSSSKTMNILFPRTFLPNYVVVILVWNVTVLLRLSICHVFDFSGKNPLKLPFKLVKSNANILFGSKNFKMGTTSCSGKPCSGQMGLLHKGPK